MYICIHIIICIHTSLRTHTHAHTRMYTPGRRVQRDRQLQIQVQPCGRKRALSAGCGCACALDVQGCCHGDIGASTRKIEQQPMAAANGPSDKNCYVWCAECSLSLSRARAHVLSVVSHTYSSLPLSLSLVLVLTGHLSLARACFPSLALSLSRARSSFVLRPYGVDA
jgi:hypothetical protein